MDPIKTILSQSTPDSVIIDAGCNIGGYTYLLIQGEGVIHAFDANAKLAGIVSKRFEGNPRVKVFPFGLSDREYSDTSFTFCEAWCLTKPDEAKHHISQGATDIVGKDLFDVDFVTIDGHVKRHNIQRVSACKLDCDGWEGRILKGAIETINRDRPLIMTELSYCTKDIGDSIPAMINFIFDTMKYRVYKEDGGSLSQAFLNCEFPMTGTLDVLLLPSEITLSDVMK